MYFDELVQVRVKEEQIEKIKEIIKKNNDYENVSHFIRCSIIKLVREESTTKKY